MVCPAWLSTGMTGEIPIPAREESLLAGAGGCKVCGMVSGREMTPCHGEGNREISGG